MVSAAGSSGELPRPGVEGVLLEKRNGSGLSAVSNIREPSGQDLANKCIPGVLFCIRDSKPSTSMSLIGLPARSLRNVLTVSRFLAGDDESCRVCEAAGRVGVIGTKLDGGGRVGCGT